MRISKKICSVCKEEKQLSCFSKRAHTPVRYQSYCKACANESKRVERKKFSNRVVISSSSKKCGKCNIEKTPDKFHKDRTNITGLTNMCKLCDKEYRQGVKTKRRNTAVIPFKKTCVACNTEKQMQFFYKKEMSKDGLSTKCTTCTKDEFKKFNSTKKEYRRVAYSAYRKKYLSENKEREYAKNRSWISRNKDRYLEMCRKYATKKYRTDISYKLRLNLRHRLLHSIKRGVKSDDTVALLGCSIDFLKKYLETTFTNGMSWELFFENKLHIDHIIPCKHFNLTESYEQYLCFNYRNLQFLWVRDNLKKGCSLLVPSTDMVLWGDPTKTLEERKDALSWEVFGEPYSCRSSNHNFCSETAFTAMPSFS